MSVAVNTIPKSTAIVAIGSCSGRVTKKSFLSPVAPSTFAASSTSFGIDASPAIMITVAKGSSRQACTVVIAASALFGSPSHCGGLNSSTSERWTSVQFTIEKSESKIQRNPIVESATGAAQGSRIRKRANHLPGKSRTRKCARMAAPTTTITFASSVKTIVFRKAVRKFSSDHWSA